MGHDNGSVRQAEPGYYQQKPQPKLVCDVCRRPEKEVVRVASSPFAPIPWAYSEECLEKPATTLVGFAYLYDFVSTNGKGLRDEVAMFFTWRDGKYESWAEYCVYRATFPLCEKHSIHMDRDATGAVVCAVCGFEEACEDDPNSPVRIVT